MPVPQNIADLITRLNAATDEVAKDLQDLRDKIAAHTITLDEVGAALSEPIARLEVLGEDPANPIPPA